MKSEKDNLTKVVRSEYEMMHFKKIPIKRTNKNITY